MLEDGDKII